MNKKLEEEQEIHEYIARFKDVSPEEILKHLGELRDFIYSHMTPEGREYFRQSRREYRDLEFEPPKSAIGNHKS